MDWKRKVVPLLGQHSKPQLQLATVDVHYQGNRGLQKELGINALPTVQFYYQGGKKMNEFVCTSKDFFRLEEALEYYLHEASSEDLQLETQLEEAKLSLSDSFLVESEEFATEFDL